MQTKSLSIIGSTGSIGRSALEIVDLHPEKFEVTALAAYRNSRLLFEQCRKYRPKVAALYDPEAADELTRARTGLRVLTGMDGVIEAACHPDTDLVVSAISGAAGLLPTYHAIRAGKDIALANKEALVTAGELLIPLSREHHTRLIPIDSEHSALNQCLRGDRIEDVKRLVLTASGGPLLDRSKTELETVSVEEALNHPTWNMGLKITIDSATLMNKGLEVIEAHHLFGVPPDRISVVIHPQSLIHSLVEFIDGTFLAQMSITDMKSPILYALTYPERSESRLPSLNLCRLPGLEFREPDPDRFACLRLAYEALQAGGTCPTVLNAANEIAVERFLKGEISFPGIPRLIEDILSRHRVSPIDDLQTVLDTDRRTREEARRRIPEGGR